MEKNHLIISVNVDKAFYKIQHALISDKKKNLITGNERTAFST